MVDRGCDRRQAVGKREAVLDALVDLIHPGQQGVGAVQRVAFLAVEPPVRARHRGVRAVQRLRQRRLLLDGCRQLLPRPAVRLIQVHIAAEEEFGKQLVAVAAHPVLVLRLWREVRGQPVSKRGERLLRLLDHVGTRRDAQVVQGGAGLAEALALVDHRVDLAVRGDVAAVGRLRERLFVPAQRRRDLGHARGDVLEVLLGDLRHEQEGITDRLDRGLDVVQTAQEFTPVVQLQLEGEPVAQDRGGEPIDVVEVVLVVGGVRGVVERIHVSDEVADAVRDSTPVLGTEVLQLSVEAIEPDLGAHGGGEFRVVVDEVLTRGVEKRRLALILGFGHGRPVYPNWAFDDHIPKNKPSCLKWRF